MNKHHGEKYRSTHNIALDKLGTHFYCKMCVKNQTAVGSKYSSTNDVVLQKKTQFDFSKLGIPRRYMQSTFDNYISKYVVQKNIYEAIRDYTSNFNKGLQKNLIFIGGAGVGKTHLACSMLKVLAGKGLRVKFTTSYDLLNRFIENWKNPNFFESSEIDNFATYDLLVIDEYGLYDQKDFQKDYIHRVLLKRYELKKPTVIISNQKNTEIQESLGFRVWSRLNQDGLEIYEFIWGDIRINKETY